MRYAAIAGGSDIKIKRKHGVEGCVKWAGINTSIEYLKLDDDVIPHMVYCSVVKLNGYREIPFTVILFLHFAQERITAVTQQKRWICVLLRKADIKNTKHKDQ
jgi:hypothetical protein